MKTNNPKEPGNITAAESNKQIAIRLSDEFYPDKDDESLKYIYRSGIYDGLEYASPHIKRCQELETLNHLRSKDTSIERINDVIRIQKEVIEKYKAQLHTERERGKALVDTLTLIAEFVTDPLCKLNPYMMGDMATKALAAYSQSNEKGGGNG